jgi:MFS family permease
MAPSRIDIYILFSTRILRLFAYGFLSVTLVLYLTKLGVREQVVAFLFTLALVGDAIISFLITTSADRIGRRWMLILGALLIVVAGGVIAFTDNLILISIAAVVGVISPSGNEIGPFLSIEQAALSQTISDKFRTRVFAWYNLVGSFSTAIGALVSGGFVQVLQRAGLSEISSYRATLLGYMAIGIVLVLFVMCLSPAVEAVTTATTTTKPYFGLHRSRNTVIKLSGLFALDAFAGGFVIQSLVAYWFYLRFGVEPIVLGSIFFGANILAGISALLAERIALRIGLINTMVFTHIPSNILLMLVPLMPNLATAVIVLLLRFSISQMDVPTRQSYTMAVVSPGERSAASGITTTARSIGALISPTLSGQFLATSALMGMPFFLAGGLKIIYDVLLYRTFHAIKPSEEVVRQ